MARFPSIGRQVQLILYQHKGIGESKLESRNSSGIVSEESGHKLSNKIHSTKSLENIRNDLTNLGNYAKEKYGIKDMSRIDQEVVEDWIRDKDVSYNTASNYLSEINKVHEHLNITREEVKEIRSECKYALRQNKLESRAYKHLDKIQLPDRSQPAFELQRDYGLRVGATIKINIDKQLDGNTFFYREKGGKWSKRELSPSLVSKIKENAINGKYEISYNTYKDQLKKAIEKTGQKYNGTHGMRHSYTQNQIVAGRSKKEVSKDLGHSRGGIINTYIR